MKYGLCTYSFLPVWKTPQWGELSNQLLFGDTFEVLEEQHGGLSKIRSTHDGYEGWFDLQQCVEIEGSKYDALNGARPRFALDLFTVVQTNESPITIVCGSRLPEYKVLTLNAEGAQFDYPGRTVQPVPDCFHRETLHELAKSYVGCPYLWGGRSPFGLDCSGFTQIIFRLLGKTIGRDCSEQIEQGCKISFAEARAGDLAFCQSVKWGGRHVGIVLDPGQVIHSDTTVHIDVLSERGVVSVANGQISHTNLEIRRYFD